MKIQSLLLATIAIFSIGSFAEEFGGKIQLKDKISISKAVELAKSGQVKNPVLVEAEVKQVCKASGCWMTLLGAKEPVRVTFKDYGFFVPTKLEGKKVLIEGNVKVKKMSLKETKHYVKDAGGDPSKVTEGKSEVRMVATAVRSKD